MDGKVVMAPADWGNSSIAYRTDLVDDDFKKNESWAIFYDDKYAGKVSMLDNELAILIGAMVGGKTYEEAYKLSGAALGRSRQDMGREGGEEQPLPVDRRFRTAAGSGLRRDRRRLCLERRRQEPQAGGRAVAYAKPKEGYFTWFCGLTLLNSGKADPALAYDFIDAWLSPETGKYLIEGSGYGHANMKSFEVANPDDVAAMGITDPVEHMKSGDPVQDSDGRGADEQNKVWGDIKALKQ